MSGQSDAAAERSFHEKPDFGLCLVCRSPFKGGASHAARVLPVMGLVQVCSEACSAKPPFSDSPPDPRVALDPIILRELLRLTEPQRKALLWLEDLPEGKERKGAGKPYVNAMGRLMDAGFCRLSGRDTWFITDLGRQAKAFLEGRMS